MRYLLFCMICLGCVLFAEEEIIVYVPSQTTLTPIYISSISPTGSGFDPAYVRSLEKVFRYDFEQDGKTEIISTKQTPYQIGCQIIQKKATIKLSMPGSSKGLEDIVLTGELAKDRSLFHQVHDTLFKELFHLPGIATTKILYTVRFRQGDHSDQWENYVWEADYDGGNAHQLTYDGALCVAPIFVPARQGHAKKIFYVSYQVGQPKIYALSRGQKGGERVTFLRGNQLMPAISLSLDKIAFISDITGNPDLFIQEYSPEQGLMGKPRQIFCAPGAAQGSPTLSPNGKKIAFVSNKDGTPRVYLLEILPLGASVKQLRPKMISKKNRENTSPARSPDGKKIAYSALTSGVRQIWIYDIATGEEMQLTDGFGHKENPTWAPDSFHLMFNSSTPTSSDLFMVNLNQKKVVKVTGGAGEKRFPAWEPINIKGTE